MNPISVALQLCLGAVAVAAPTPKTPATASSQTAATAQTQQQQAPQQVQQQAQQQMQDINDQEQAEVTAVHEKYQKHRYALMEKVTPGSGTAMQQVDALQTKFRFDMKALGVQERAELDALTVSATLDDRKAIRAKYAAQRQALQQTFQAARKQLMPQPTTQPTAK